MPHKFDARNHARLLGPERRRRQSVEPALALLDLAPEHVLIDVGCGPGYFLLPAARRVRSALGLDISPAMLAALSKGARVAGLRNVRGLRMGEAKVPLPSGAADRALLVNVLHELQAPGKVLAEICRALRPGGRLVLVDWKRRRTKHGPPVAERVGARDRAPDAGRGRLPTGRRPRGLRAVLRPGGRQVEGDPPPTETVPGVASRDRSF